MTQPQLADPVLSRYCSLAQVCQIVEDYLRRSAGSLLTAGEAPNAQAFVLMYALGYEMWPCARASAILMPWPVHIQDFYTVAHSHLRPPLPGDDL
jgi:hypothetical protein